MIDEIIFGDAYELIKDVPEKSVDCIITDIPYDIDVSHGCGIYGTDKCSRYSEYSKISHGIDYAILDEFVRVMKKINCYIWCSKNQILPIANYFVGHGCYWNIISWHKTNACPACGNKYMNDTEYCLFFREKGVRLYGTAKTKTTYYVTAMNTADKKRYGHPTIKPLAIIENFIENSVQPGGTVLDPFIGSGTTAVAAKNKGCRYIGFEIDPEWCEVARRRLGRVGKRSGVGY